MSVKCNSCGKQGGNLRPCSRCHQAHYCDATCQRVNWVRHKMFCGKREAGGESEFEFSLPAAPEYTKRDQEPRFEEPREKESAEKPSFEDWMKQFPAYPTPKNAAEMNARIEDMMRIAGITELSHKQRAQFLDDVLSAAADEQEAKLALERELILQATGASLTKRAQIAKYDKHCAKLAKEMVEGLIEGGLENSGQFYGKIRKLVEEGMRVMGEEMSDYRPSEDVLMGIAAEIYNGSYDTWNV